MVCSELNSEGRTWKPGGRDTLIHLFPEHDMSIWHHSPPLTRFMHHSARVPVAFLRLQIIAQHMDEQCALCLRLELHEWGLGGRRWEAGR